MHYRRDPESCSNTMTVSEVQEDPGASFMKIAGMSDAQTGNSPASPPQHRVPCCLSTQKTKAFPDLPT